MNFKYKLEIEKDGEKEISEYKTLKEISKALNIEIHLIRKINQLCENRSKSIKPHYQHRELYDKIKIYNIKKDYKI
jgi:hypothetical protein